MSEGFLGRWARRKEAARTGQPLAPEPTPAPSVAPAPPAAPVQALAPGPAEEAERPPAPTLEDVQALTRDSDFSRFVQPDVSPDVKNAALRKLFSDPHFNVMDRLDIYIDDYSQPDPIPPAMLRNLASSRFLGLFRDEEEAREGPDTRGGETVAQSEPAAGTPGAVPTAAPHADPDLRLQQDDAPGPEGPGPRTG